VTGILDGALHVETESFHSARQLLLASLAFIAFFAFVAFFALVAFFASLALIGFWILGYCSLRSRY
jgi:hypothetical protein